MRLTKAWLILASTLMIAVACNKTDKDDSNPVENLIPEPFSYSTDTGHFELTAATLIYADSSDSAVLSVADYFNEQTSPATGFKLKINSIDAAAAKANFGSGPAIYFLLEASDSTIGNEGYTLNVKSDEIVITAYRPAGLFYGVQTLRQLLPHAIENRKKTEMAWKIPCTTITDQPSYAYRGGMLDIARHFFGVPDIKRFIDFLSFYKMNALHLHLTDDQGWRIEIKSWPELTNHGGSTQVGGGTGGFLTQEQYKDIVAYAAKRFVTIIPEVDMPGHTNAALSSYAFLNCNDTATKLYTGTEVGFSTLCTSKDSTFILLKDVIRELAAITPGPYLHIGGDESHVTKKEDYIPFMEKVQAMVVENGKTAIGWDEIANCQLLPNTVAQYWADAANSKLAVSKGAKLIMSPARKSYLDMQYDSTCKFGLHWAGYVEVDSAYLWDMATLEPGITKENILGVEAPLWTETISKMDDLEFMVFPRLPGLAEIGWTAAEARNWDGYKKRLGHHAERMKALKIDFYASPKIAWK